ncbi:alpha/beta fold hydrolase [Alteromonas sp. ASW11-130]|uniref:alpha/beta fold hydrolase n=1 Tax=Alteromonas sp. ASW11-130 TaxID=3015775 RepID=UPI002242A46A|nr:alpha/beta hydrolase [Alteromonas sp. ASW11-130]MCW8090790.1 alpha/beta hydrolase [Alteromonas sp. ASW11-130]
MSVEHRNNVKVLGSGSETIVFAHGFGCDQNMWKYLVPSYEPHYRIVLFDLVGSGKSDLSAYDFDKYDSLQGYADDLIEIIDEFCDSPVIFVGHSVSATIGMLAAVDQPEKFKCLVMVGPSPSYINDGDYTGGFTRADIEELCDTIDCNYLGWSSNMAPAIMGAPDQPELAVELTNSFCRTDPTIATHFARVTFFSDHRDALAKCSIPSLILQCSDDFIAPLSVGEYMNEQMPDAQMVIIENVGHCPHLSAPHASIDAINAFLKRLL